MPLLLVPILVASLFGQVSMAVATSRRTIETVNAVLGDESFVVRFGREPADADPEQLRIQTHLAHVEGLLRRVDVSRLPDSLRRQRRFNLDNLREYREAAQFPVGESATGRLPVFVDRDGNRCAVAYLVERSAGNWPVRQVDDRYHNAYIRDIDSPDFARWIAGSGLSVHELAMIQPTYSEPPVLRRAFSAALEYLPDAEELDDTHVIASGTGHVWLATGERLERMVGSAATAGFADNAHLAYRVQVVTGLTWLMAQKWNLGARVGLGADGLTGVVSPALFLPADLFWRVEAIELRGGVEWSVAGAERPVGWRGVFRVMGTVRSTVPWYVDLLLANRWASPMVGLALGMGASDSAATWADWRPLP